MRRHVSAGVLTRGHGRRASFDSQPPRRCLDPLQGHRRGDCRLRRLFPRRAARPAPAPARGDAVGPLAAQCAADLGAAPRAAALLGRHAAGGVPGPPDTQHGHRVAGRDDRAAVPDQLQRGAHRAPRSCGASAMPPIGSTRSSACSRSSSRLRSSRRSSRASSTPPSSRRSARSPIGRCGAPARSRTCSRPSRWCRPSRRSSAISSRASRGHRCGACWSGPRSGSDC